MALCLTPHHSLLLHRNPRNPNFLPVRSQNPNISFSSIPKNSRISSFPVLNASYGEESNKTPIEKPSKDVEFEENSLADEWEEESGNSKAAIPDEWGEKSEPEPEVSSTKLSDSDPPKNDDEWGKEEVSSGHLKGNGSVTSYDEEVTESNKLMGLKQALVDSCYGTDFGFGASAETRGEIVELVNQLETANPTPAPTESPALNGNWILVYTAFSELLPLIAAGNLPLLKLKRIAQEIDAASLTVKNTATFSSPFATFSFSASASFEIRSPSRIQVQFKEGVFPPPEISSTVNLPQSIDVFGQNVDLSPVQQSLTPLQEAVANASRVISGQPPLRVPIPGERTQSWLVTTYLDKDLRISRGDGGLFVLVMEGSSILEEQ